MVKSRAHVVVDLLFAATFPCFPYLVIGLLPRGEVLTWMFLFPGSVVASPFGGMHDLTFWLVALAVNWLFYGALTFALVHRLRNGSAVA